MGERRWTYVNKTGWAYGHDEPDKVQWRDVATGLHCLARRVPDLGHWCGYVGVPKGHRFYGQPYGECRTPSHNDLNHRGGWGSCYDARCTPESCLDVHGGITYSKFCEGSEERGVCHVPDGPDDTPYWFGFDCAHSGDVSPGMDKDMPFSPFEHRCYRTLAYVQAECAKLAQQLAAMGHPAAE